jgi:hypothetical protein
MKLRTKIALEDFIIVLLLAAMTWCNHYLHNRRNWLSDRKIPKGIRRRNNESKT